MFSKTILFFVFTIVIFISVQSIVVPESSVQPATNKPASLKQADQCQQEVQYFIESHRQNDYHFFPKTYGLYKYFTYGATFLDALKTCIEKENGNLAVIDSLDELEYLIGLREVAKAEMEKIYCRQLDYLALWIGVTALTPKHQWLSVDGYPFGPNNPYWGKKGNTKFPVNYKDWDCGSLIENGVSNNHCNYTSGFICEVKVPVCPPPQPQQPDCRAQLQATKGNCQYLSSTLRLQSENNGYLDTDVGLHKIFAKGKSWFAANKTCVEREGGRLAIINSRAEEQELAYRLFKKKPDLENGADFSQMVWIGIFSYQPNQWITVNGQPLNPNSSYVHWTVDSNGVQQPNNYDGKQNCGSLSMGGFDDYSCNLKLGYICEIPVVAC